MNYLAHLYLAEPDDQHRLGNLAGDWVKGRLENQPLAPRVLAGVRRHRWVDSTTDSHPAVRNAHRLFSPERRRAVPVILDLVFDHLLVRDWEVLATQPLDAFLADCYASLRRTEPLWPEAARRILPHLVENDWLSRYGDLDVVCVSLERIADRLSRDIGLRDARSEIQCALPALVPIQRQVLADLREALADRRRHHA